jgi:hypothetical protein
VRQFALDGQVVAGRRSNGIALATPVSRPASGLHRTTLAWRALIRRCRFASSHPRRPPGFARAGACTPSDS